MSRSARVACTYATSSLCRLVLRTMALGNNCSHQPLVALDVFPILEVVGDFWSQRHV